MGQPQITYEEVRQLFDYEPDTGKFIRRLTTSSRARKGDVAGCLNTGGYLVVRIGSKLHYVHRLIYLWMTGDWPEEDIDHINRKRSDNCWENLRATSRSQNLHNREIASGVYWASRDSVWVASIQVHGIKTHIGQHKDRAVAEAMYAREKERHTP